MTPPILPKIVNCVVESKDNGAFTITNYVDTKGFDFIRYIIATGHVEVACEDTYDPKITECATSGGSYTDITSALHDIAATDDDNTYVIDVKLGGARLRYQKVACTAGDGSATAMELAVIALLYRADTRLNTYADAGLDAAADWLQL